MAEVKVARSTETLDRGIMPWHVSLIALGGIIGSCYFLELGMTYNAMGPGAVLIAYLIAGITIFGVMQSFAEMLVNIPRRGSFVSYTRQFMGDTASAGIGWAFWANWVCYIPSEAIATAIFINALIPGEQGPFLTFLWGIIALVLLTLINVFQVTWFGHVESIMAIIKIAAIILFIIFGVLIFFGILNNGGHVEGNDTAFDIGAGFIGTKVALGQAIGDTFQHSIVEKLFPSGGFLIITLMIWTLVNFQGSEIVGLSAAETQNPEKNVPKACKSVAYRIILIYLVPIFVLSLIMPYYAATLESSVFAQALAMYGFGWGAKLFTVVTLIAAFSCANSGFYGTVRSLYGLSVEGLAPKFLAKLNKYKTPQNATLFTLAFIWIIYMLSFAMDQLGMFGGGDNALFTALIGIAGFTGTLCWVGILYSQIIFRRRLVARGYDPKKVLGVKANGYPLLAWFSIIVQILAMVLLIFEAGDGLPIFVLSMDIIIVPVVIFVIQKYRGNIRQTISIGDDEVMFDDKFPVQTGSRAEQLIAANEAKIKKTGNPIGTIVMLIVVTVISLVVSFIAIGKNPAELESDAFTAIFTDPSMPVVWALIGVLIVTYVIIVIGVVNLDRYKPIKENTDV
ncbi:MAG: amino acid permease [Clostridiales Family XIII bacterium]|jgi:AAT family amino acid transporter|nr:amino acid permease [Clostridiales Family XIII bacterium]